MYKEILCNFDNIYKAYKIAHRGKTDDKEVIEFDKDKIYNLKKLQEKLLNKQWDEIFTYYRFVITDPKKRTVDALYFEGRIVQHVLCDLILRPYFERRLIKENAACRINKGTEYAVNLLKKGIIEYYKKNDDGYVLQADVHKYFPSIDRKKLKEIIDYPNKEILELIHWIIDCAPGNGIPIGNQSSQWFALYYLDKIDRIIKEKYRCKIYVRYMDDLIVIDKSKDKLKRILGDITQIGRECGLEFNGKTQIFPLRKGICFLSWKFIRKENIIKLLNPRKKSGKIKKIKEIFNEEPDKFWERFQSMRAYLRLGNTYYFRKKRLIYNYI